MIVPMNSTRLSDRISCVMLASLLLAGAVPSAAQTVPPGGKEQVDKMIAVLKSDAPLKEKVDVCRGLAVVGTKDAVPALAALLGDEKLSHMARYALEPIPDPAVDDALRDALGKLKGRLLVGVIGSIGVRRDAKAVEPLAKRLQDSDSDVVQAAARSLGCIGTPEAAKALQIALPSAAAANLPALYEGLLRSGEAMIATGQRGDAIAVYDRLRALPTAPRHVRAAASRGAILARGAAK
jgi:HEAT repeat protein